MVKRFSDQINSEIDKKMMEAISSLKRAIGAPDHRTKDYLAGHITAHIYTPDSESNHILNALFHQFLHGDKPVFQLDKKGKGVPVPLNRALKQTGEELYEVEVQIPDSQKLQFIERIDDYIEKILAPTSPERNTWRGTVPSPRPIGKAPKVR